MMIVFVMVVMVVMVVMFVMVAVRHQKTWRDPGVVLSFYQLQYVTALKLADK